MVEGDGFEPSYARRPDLQSGGFNHSPTPPRGALSNGQKPYETAACESSGAPGPLRFRRKNGVYSRAASASQPVAKT